ncbi:GntR family transcriptional regulator [Streptomyces sp. GC420]|uniref:GntR family transcriptional regulator n=1 Tax=Streptomyces sp. GC420 TaxID=2697568 RepID=UPI001414FDAA|nr:GntR family transcriptional regulator [Streptomyces sp. GC420]NBM17489.1 UTRA domain-containing protein [Streptomyces sp. GC420]
MATRYQNIADALRRRIASEEWPPGARLPSETQLASQHRVSGPTLRSALDVLETEGLIEKRHGIGNFVRVPLQRITYSCGEISADGQAAANTALRFSVSSSVVEAERDLSSLLGVPLGAPLTEYTYVSRLDRTPYSLARVYLPSFVAPLNVPAAGRSPWGDDFGDRFAEAGLRLSSVAERFGARHATAKEAEILHISIRTSVLTVERTSVDETGRVIAAALLVLPGDRAEAVLTTRAKREEAEWSR